MYEIMIVVVVIVGVVLLIGCLLVLTLIYLGERQDRKDRRRLNENEDPEQNISRSRKILERISGAGGESR